MTRAVTRLVLCGAVALAGLTGCGDEPRASDTAAEELQLRVAEIRELANARQPDQVTAKLSELRLVVDDLRRRDELTEEGAREVLAAAAAVDAQLGLITTTTTTTTTQPPPSEDDGDGDEGDDD